MIILYKALGCPKCSVLQSKLDSKKIKYIPVIDIDTMIQKGYQSAPILEIDGTPLSFITAMNWADTYLGD